MHNIYDYFPLAEVKNYLKIDHDHDDSLVKDMILAAENAAEKYLGISVFVKIKTLSLTQVLSHKVALRYAPAQEILVITMRGKKMDKKNYYLCDDNQHIYFKQLVNAPVKIEYIAGYKPQELPASIKQAMLIHVAAMYQKREFSENIPLFASGLYQHHKIKRII
jgi:uncharacterized phiE125 gp8 family phage protein